ncbi:hypothetical protein HY642_06480 [Candidatus Woesearchaeota archaeon]|nr:hypothetical protein [Candidatus Woesearchaeota archaeon]
MSSERIRTPLKGYDRQVFPQLRDLNSTYDMLNAVRASVDKVFGSMPEFKRYDEPKTEDQYLWWRGYYFSAGKGTVAVLLPWKRTDSRSELQLDRSIGVYTRGNVPQDRIEDIVRKLDDRMRTLLVQKNI